MIVKRIHEPYRKPPEGVDVVWRLDARSYAYCVDPYADEWATTAPKLELTWHRIERRTPKGFFVHGRFQLADAKRGRYRNTREEAIQHFRQRREKQIEILEGQLQRARYELGLMP